MLRFTPTLLHGIRLLVVCGLGLASSLPAASGTVEGLAQSRLGTVAAALAPSEFRRLEPSLPKGVARYADLIQGAHPDGRGAPPIDTWTDHAHWDAQRARIFFQGLRQSNRFLSYHAIGNRWEEIGLQQDNAPPLFERFGHLYGRTALDARRGHFYRLVGNTLHRYAIDAQRWDKFEGTPLGGYISIDWNVKRDMLVGLARGGNLQGLHDGRWSLLGHVGVDGYHSSAKYNTVRGDMLFIGGNNSPRAVALLTADGGIRQRRDAPFDYSIRSDDLTHDPVSGNYLVLHHEHVLWEYNPDLDTWRVALDWREAQAGWPFGGHASGIVPVPVDELGLVVWLTSDGLLAYKHRSVFPANAAARAGSPPATTTRRP